jgi:hypothetical protein
MAPKRHNSGKNEQTGNEIRVIPNMKPQPTLRIKPKWSYQLKIVEILGHDQFDIHYVERFAKAGSRPWVRGWYTDKHGALKVLVDLTAARGKITDPLIIDFSVNWKFKQGEKKTITARIETAESRKLFVKDLWLRCD